MKIIKFQIVIIKLPRGQNDLNQRKSFLISKKMRKNLWKQMNLKSLINKDKISKI